MENQTSHQIVLGARTKLDINGVKEVIGFDEENAQLLTVCGLLNIDGREIKVSVLDMDKGVISISGTIDSIYYNDQKEEVKTGFFGRLLK